MKFLVEFLLESWKKSTGAVARQITEATEGKVMPERWGNVMRALQLFLEDIPTAYDSVPVSYTHLTLPTKA